MFGHIAATIEGGQIVEYKGQDPYVLKTTGETCMIATINLENGVAWLDRMHVRQDQRESGYAGQMLEFLERQCRIHGASEIQTIIDTDFGADQAGAERWVMKRGFVLVDEQFNIFSKFVEP